MQIQTTAHSNPQPSAQSTGEFVAERWIALERLRLYYVDPTHDASGRFNLIELQRT